MSDFDWNAMYRIEPHPQTFDEAWSINEDVGLLMGDIFLEVNQQEDSVRIRWASPDADGYYIMGHPSLAQQYILPDLESAKLFISDKWPDALASHEWELQVWIA